MQRTCQGTHFLASGSLELGASDTQTGTERHGKTVLSGAETTVQRVKAVVMYHTVIDIRPSPQYCLQLHECGFWLPCNDDIARRSSQSQVL